MHVTSIDRYGLDPGIVTEWSLQPADGAVTESEYHRRTTSIFTSRLREHTAWAGVWMAAAFDLPGELNRPALDLALRLFISRHDTLHTGFEVGEFTTTRMGLDPDGTHIETSEPLKLIRPKTSERISRSDSRRYAIH
ncbi:hypothetical protein ACETU7_36075 [Rhodococcus sp. 3Y1]